MKGTPARVVRAYEEWFSGYAENPSDYLKRTFDEVAGYDEVVVLRDITFEFIASITSRPSSAGLTSATYRANALLEFRSLQDLSMFSRSVFRSKKR